MKYIIIAILFFIISSCVQNEGIYKEMTLQFHRTIQIIDFQSNQIFSTIENEATNELGCNPKLIPWYNKMLYVRSSCNGIIIMIDSLVNDLKLRYSENKTGTQIEDFSFRNESITLNNQILESLKNKIHNFLDICTELIDQTKHEPIIEHFNKLLNTNNWNEIKSLSGTPSTVCETIACLYKVKLDLKLAESDILNYLNAYIDLSGTRFFAIDVVVEPNALSLRQGEIYKADIFPACIDQTLDVSIEIEGEKIKTQNGIGKYNHFISEAPGNYIKIGSVCWKDTYTGKDTKIPFRIEYEVLEKMQKKGI